jgi:serine/threonine-protein kinase RsbW
MTSGAVHRTLDSTLESADQIEHLVMEHAQRAGFDSKALDQISLAVHETAVNAVMHGNRQSTEKKVTVDICVTAGQFRITIADEGDGFDPAKVPDPLADQELFRERGRGIYLSRALMDEYEVRPRAGGGCEVTLVKYLK